MWKDMLSLTSCVVGCGTLCLRHSSFSIWAAIVIPSASLVCALMFETCSGGFLVLTMSPIGQALGIFSVDE